MHSYILTSDNPKYEWTYIPEHDSINPQIIIKKYINGRIHTYNFNANMIENNMGKIENGMSQLLGIPPYYSYKRVIINSNEIHIYETSDDSNVQVRKLDSSHISLCIEP